MSPLRAPRPRSDQAFLSSPPGTPTLNTSNNPTPSKAGNKSRGRIPSLNNSSVVDQDCPMEDEKAANLSDHLRGLINIIVSWNGDADTFPLHSNHIKARSPTLAALITDPLMKDFKYTANPAQFQVWTTWSYYGKIEFHKLIGKNSVWDVLIDLYLLGWKLGDPTFMNELSILICRESRAREEVIDFPNANRIYRDTPSTLPLRRLLVDMWVAGIPASELKYDTYKGLDPAFLFDMWKRTMEAKERKGKIKMPEDNENAYKMPEGAPLPSFGMRAEISIDDDDEEEMGRPVAGNQKGFVKNEIIEVDSD